MNFKIFKYKNVNSTNDIAIKLIKKKNIKIGMVVSEKQKRGRGQRGKKWISYKGNLFVSIFYSLEKMKYSVKELTKINAKLIIKLLEIYYKKSIKLKLPNDILINKKKICGILQENIQKNEVNYLIVGVGLNLIKNPHIKDYQTTNLYDLTKKKINVKKISFNLKCIYENFLRTQKVY